MESRMAGSERAGNGRRAAGVRCARKRDVALAGKQAGSRIEPDPSRARKIDFGPGVKVGEIAGGPRGAFERFDIGAI